MRSKPRCSNQIIIKTMSKNLKTAQQREMAKVTLITGAASGLGWALAQAFHRRGDVLVLTDIDAARLAQRCAELDDDARILAFSGDVTAADFPQALLERIGQRFGRLDILVNNAGITHRSLVQRTDPRVFDRVMAVDWQAPVRLSCAALPMLRDSRGKIVNIGSMAGWMPVLGRAAYCAAKAALTQFFEVLRCEIADDGVRVLNVYPSFLDTPIETNALGADGRPAQHRRSMVGAMRSAEWMAAMILRAERRERPWLFPDRLSWFGSCLWRLWPAQYLRLMRKRFAVELQV
jgi:NAD(P)-dependent dehydrogenase (short-subunit alcohol dehydrogenase family)